MPRVSDGIGLGKDLGIGILTHALGFLGVVRLGITAFKTQPSLGSLSCIPPWSITISEHHLGMRMYDYMNSCIFGYKYKIATKQNPPKWKAI